MTTQYVYGLLQIHGIPQHDGRLDEFRPLAEAAPSQERSHRMAALLQQIAPALDADLCQPDAVRGKLIGDLN